MRLDVRVPLDWTGRVSARISLAEDGDLAGPEALAYLDGVPFHGIDRYHREIDLTGYVEPGGQHEILLEAYSSLRADLHTVTALQLVDIDNGAEALYHDLRVLGDVALAMPEISVDRGRLIRALHSAYVRLDLRDPGSVTFAESVEAARRILAREVFDAESGIQPAIVAVGHAHIDLAWLWPVTQTRRKGARTFSTALRLMDRYPEFQFVASQPALYQMVREDEPIVYEQIKQRIGEGRWQPTGSTWVEMDCNLPGGESLIRQFLYGRRYFREELGVDPAILWLPDVFGYSGALPQIMAGCGVERFMTTKMSWNEYNRLPHDTFRWRGIDGTPVLVQMVTAPMGTDSEFEEDRWNQVYTYNSRLTPSEVARAWALYRDKELNSELLCLYGYGDGGGGPTAEMEETAVRLRHLAGLPSVKQGSAEEYFDRVWDRVWTDPDLAEWTGELYFEYHRGTYTSQAWIKRANRMAELLYREAELWSAAAGRACAPMLAPGWKNILFHQFHDILPGSSIHEVYENARDAYDEILSLGQSVRDRALEALLASVGMAEPSLVVVNPAPFVRDDPVEVELRSDEPGPTGLTVQRLGEDRALVAASAPPLGLRAFPLGASAGLDNELVITEEVLENRYFRIRLGSDGSIVSLLDKRADREVIEAGQRGNQFVAFEDRPLRFDAWDIQANYAEKRYPVDAVTSLVVVETGPLRGGVEIVRRYESSAISQRILIYRDVPRIDFPTRVDWHEHQTLLKVAFPVAVHAERATFDIQFGNIERPTHWNTSWDWARFESWAHKWVDLSEGDYGVSLLNDCKYGHDIKGNVIRLTLIKSGVWPDAEADQGGHLFSYSLLPHPGDWRAAETVRHAYLFNMPARAHVQPGMSGGHVRSGYSLVSTDRPGLVIETVKPAEDGDGIIVRVYDAHNTRGPATLTFSRSIASAEETTMLEERIGDAEVEGPHLRVPIRPYGVGTYRIRFS
jgi:alpha-mannosidase